MRTVTEFVPDSNMSSWSDRGEKAFEAFEKQPRSLRSLEPSLQALAGAGQDVWLDAVRHFVLAHYHSAAANLLEMALIEHPRSVELLFASAGLLMQAGQWEMAEVNLSRLLTEAPGHIGGSFLLARLLQQQGRMQAVSRAIAAIFEHPPHDLELAIKAVELLDDSGRKEHAAELCDAVIAGGSADPRLYAYSAMLLAQLGQFEQARNRYEFVAAHSLESPNWHVPQGLAGLQRYQSAEHPDFALFNRYLNENLDDPARASLLYALGKAHDDISDFEKAAYYLRQANILDRADNVWSRKLWRRNIEARRQRTRTHEQRISGIEDQGWTPVFIVGAIRSGSTLLAKLLSQHPSVCHQGELPWLPRLAAGLNPAHADYAYRLQHARDVYAAQLRQDHSDARWFIDKQLHNFLHIDVILTLFPQAKIIRCRRNARDCGLSMWMQAFQANQQPFANDFIDIGAMIRGERQLMQHWESLYPEAIRTVHYENLTSDPGGCIEAISRWLDLPENSLIVDNNSGPIATASMWQARQPVHTRSVARWKDYAFWLPELLQLPDD